MTWPHVLGVLRMTWPRRGGAGEESYFDLSPNPRPRCPCIRRGPVPKPHHGLSLDPSEASAAGDPVLAQMTWPRTPWPRPPKADDLSPWSQTLNSLRDR